MATPPTGRPEKPMPDGADQRVVAVAQALRDLRHRAGLSLRELSQSANYSTATLSSAASGKSLPRWEVVKAYATGCGAKAELERLHILWRQAKTASEPAASPGHATSANHTQVHGPRTTAATSPTTVRPHRRETSTSFAHAVRQPPVSVARQVLPAPRAGRRPDRAASPSSRAPEDPGSSVPALVRQAQTLDAATSTTSTNPGRTGLLLCTTPEHFIAMMHDLYQTTGMSLRELSERTKSTGHPVSRSRLHDVLTGNRLPSTEVLFAFLQACAVPSDHWPLWHHTRTRLKIAQLITQNDKKNSLLRRLRADRALRSAILYMLVLIVLCIQLVLVLDRDNAPATLPPDSRWNSVTVFPLLTDGRSGMRQGPIAHLSPRPEVCRTAGCHKRATEVATGTSVIAMCKASGERISNSGGPDPVNDYNPGLYTSTLWYKVITPDRRRGYLSDAWLTPADRGGLELPHC